MKISHEKYTVIVSVLSFLTYSCVLCLPNVSYTRPLRVLWRHFYEAGPRVYGVLALALTLSQQLPLLWWMKEGERDTEKEGGSAGEEEEVEGNGSSLWRRLLWRGLIAGGGERKTDKKWFNGCQRCGPGPGHQETKLQVGAHLGDRGFSPCGRFVNE